MALFAVNTGCRDQEVCNLRWEWEVKVPELGTSVFIIPGTRVKNSDERLVVLNSVVALSCRIAAGQASRVRFHLRGQADYQDADFGLEEGAR